MADSEHEVKPSEQRGGTTPDDAEATAATALTRPPTAAPISPQARSPI